MNESCIYIALYCLLYTQRALQSYIYIYIYGGWQEGGMDGVPFNPFPCYFMSVFSTAALVICHIIVIAALDICV